MAHLIRTAQGLAESVETGMARFGGRVHAELQRLCHMGTERPTVGQWQVWYARCRSLVNQYITREDKAGTFARRLARELTSRTLLEAIHVFFQEHFEHVHHTQ